jgi:CheY-like chemotaxis protein
MTLPALADTPSLPPIVLLLDDEPDILEMYSTHFQAEGVWVATAASAREGMIAVEELRPDTVITDIGFGGEPSGASFVEALRARPDTREIPLIVLTGLADGELPGHLRKDADLFLRKPIAPAALLLNVRRLLDSSYVLRARSGRVRARASELMAKSEGLLARGKMLTPAPVREARCPQCLEPLTWLDTGMMEGREFEYYDWCERGCGLYCFDTATRSPVRLA